MHGRGMKNSARTMRAKARATAVLIVAGMVLGGCGSMDSASKRDMTNLAATAGAGAAIAGVGSLIESGVRSNGSSSPVYAKDFSRDYPRADRASTSESPSARASKDQSLGAPTARHLDGSLMEVDVVPLDDPDAAGPGMAAPVFAAQSRTASAGAIEVDAIVGSINGNPVRAGEFLAPVAAKLAAMGKEPGATRVQWRQRAFELIETRLNDEVRSELLLSAGLSELTPQQREGLSMYMLNERRRVIATARGSEEAADQALRAEGMGGLEPFMAELKKDLITQSIINERIRPKIQVSMRDIEVYYWQHPELYRSPTQYHFRMINAAPGDDAGKVGARLEAKDSFADVALSTLNTFNADTGGMFTTPRESVQPQEESTFFEDPRLNDAARRLKPGAWDGPIEFGGSMAWLFLENVVDRTKTLFEAQIEIENKLRDERVQRNYNKYLSELRDRGSYTEVRQMALRLLAMAESQLIGPITPGVGLDAPAGVPRTTPVSATASEPVPSAGSR
jgi:parvulin-like peptidyl-prolyl isomerase